MSLRKASGGTQIASVTLAAAAAKKMLEEHGKIKIGGISCCIRRVERPIKCLKCGYYGHLATKCTSAVDRSKLCIKCSATEHKASECTDKPRCALCIEKGNTEDCAHIAGSSKCPVYKEALQKVLNKRR
ncbi:CCHC-type zinc finger protein CG3800-like [Diachasma alloeum]|uniref:CCHC-type zinc finger protein CG3800-like n=1 Tax=Diachasma alloeum TaxID=454923 RepID=UPI0007384E62|nr:CCHC-type zinc finger protein CG3800-like [Diachasma alloeum]